MDEATESPTPALDLLLNPQFTVDDGTEEPLVVDVPAETYFAAAIEAYHMLGNALSEAGAIYYMLGQVLQAIEPVVEPTKEVDV